MRQAKHIILGAGMTGLGAALTARLPVFEGMNRPGGVCHSYYVDENGKKCDPRYEQVSECFRFEPAGGHWLFGLSEDSLVRLRQFCTVRQYSRCAAVCFGDGKLVPYPLQDNLRYLDRKIRDQILTEICSGAQVTNSSFKNWLLANFGPTLCELFFFPFHERYTAGLYSDISPQDLGKSAVGRERICKGAFERIDDTGYNRTFYYPVEGLDRLVGAMGTACSIHFEHKVRHIDVESREVYFENGGLTAYERIISTIPLNRMVDLCAMKSSTQSDPATAVLVVNIGAVRNRDFRPYHWLYLPWSKSGMHRVGFYSHVDSSFLPAKYRNGSEIVSIYAERSFPGSVLPTRADLDTAAKEIVGELTDSGFITNTIVADWTFTDPAYTWSRPNSKWAPDAIHQLAQQGIHQVGRYGAWRFQGMMESFEQGRLAGQADVV